MGTASHQPDSSPYYPPRARWYGPVFYWSGTLGRLVALDRLNVPKEVSLAALVAGFLVPGLAVYFRSPRNLGRLALVLAGFLLMTFIVFLGYSMGNLAFGMLLSLHVSGYVYYCTPLFDASFRRRLLATLGTIVALSLLVYWPVLDVLQGHFFMPLSMNGHVIIVRHVSSMESVRLGDWVAYNLSEDHTWEEGGVYVLEGVGFHPGISLGPVLAMPGDRIEFSKTTFSVNGVSHPRLAHMPESGVCSVPEKQWFIWPNLAISRNEYGREARVSEVLLRMALVQESRVIGKPFQSWFWRRQILS